MSQKNLRVWAMLDPENYKRLLIALATEVQSAGRKRKLGDYVAQAVIEKLNRGEAPDGNSKSL
jgi:hypothetical protein